MKLDITYFKQMKSTTKSTTPFWYHTNVNGPSKPNDKITRFTYLGLRKPYSDSKSFIAHINYLII